MKLYQNLDVDLTYQNFGSAWLGVLRGATDNIELAFNGLYNFCATNGSLSYQDHVKCVATFWSDRKGMRRFFFNQHYIPRFEDRNHPDNGRLVRQSMRHAQAQMSLLCASHEPFMDFDNRFAPAVFTCGKITAERPDSDLKDAILSHAFAEKESVSAANKSVDAD